MNILSVKGLSKAFGKQKILNNLYLTLQTGEIKAVFGRNGCGKSTMLKILFGTQKADTIQLSINNAPVQQKDIIPLQHIAYLPQESFLPKGMKVRDIIPMYYKGDLQDKIFYAEGIHKITNTKTGNLSMGELRYFELLLVGNLNHPFLMLDEPFAMVEPLHKQKIKEFLIDLKAKKGILITDHYYNDVLSISTNNLVLKDGTFITVTDETKLKELGYLPSDIKNKR